MIIVVYLPAVRNEFASRKGNIQNGLQYKRLLNCARGPSVYDCAWRVYRGKLYCLVHAGIMTSCGATCIGRQQLVLNWPYLLLFRLHYTSKRTTTLLAFSARSKMDDSIFIAITPSAPRRANLAFQSMRFCDSERVRENYGVKCL